jgi:hypothetical protein
MLYINPALRITIFILLGFSFILFGCTSSESLTTASPIESPGGGATPGSYLPTSTLEPGIITLTPELESLVEEDDPGDVPTPILEMVRLGKRRFRKSRFER